MRTTTKRAILGAGALMVVGAGCLGWTVWDDVFDPETHTRGWFSGDGSISVPLPPCEPNPGVWSCSSTKPRTLWLYGDTWLDWNGPARFLVDNTIAVQDGQDGEPPDRDAGEIRFWASTWSVGLGRYLPADVTDSVPTFSTTTNFNMDGFFLNGEEQDPALMLPRTHWMWAASGVYLPDDGTPDGKLVLFYEHSRCLGPANTAEDYAACRAVGMPAEFLGEMLITIDTPSSPPNWWYFQQRRTDLGPYTFDGPIPRVRWGSAVLRDEGLVYLYGRPEANDPGTREVDESKQVKVAATTAADIEHYDRWYFLVNDGNGWMRWQQGAPSRVADLFTVATTGANIFSIDRIDRAGKRAYVMVDPVDGGFSQGAIRTSQTPLLWPNPGLPPRDPNLYTLNDPLPPLDAAGASVPSGPGFIVGTARVVEDEVQGLVRDYRAHPEQRGSTTVPEPRLLISYHAEIERYGQSIGKNRFLTWGLDGTYPWCAKGTDANGDGIGDDVTACNFCGNRVRASYETCDPTAPLDARFDMALVDKNGDGHATCADYEPTFASYGAATYYASDAELGCKPNCDVDFSACFPEIACRLDADCGQGEICHCTHPDYCRCSDLGWTQWLSRDTPNASGDWETLANFTEAQTCPHPTGIACRRRSDKKPADETGEILRCDPEYGLSCRNASQPDGRCDDYEVRFYCMPTPWLSDDTPNATGDWETLQRHVDNGDACAVPTGIECRTVETKTPADETGEVVTCDESKGLVCKNDDQPDRNCLDYEVRFFCGRM